MSLLYTMQGMRDRGHACMVGLARPSSQLEELYTDAGFETVAAPELVLWDHSAGAPRPLWDPQTWMMYARLFAGWRRTVLHTRQLVEQTQPDLVHLNSMTFVASARVLIRYNIPFVWHVREPAPDQGLRTRFIRTIMQESSHLIFISKFDRQQWVAGKKGEIVPNFVDLKHFRSDLDGEFLKRECRISPDEKVILYLGGVSRIKGIFVLLEALNNLKEQGQKFVCLMPGTTLGPSKSRLGSIASTLLPLIGSGTPKQKVAQKITEYSLEEWVRPLPFVTDIVPFFAAADVVVFPSTKPHFARPIIESIAMHKPAVGSDLGGVRELLDVHPLGWAVPAGDPVALAGAVKEAADSSTRPVDLEVRFDTAKRLFARERGIDAIEAIYQDLLKIDHE